MRLRYTIIAPVVAIVMAACAEPIGAPVQRSAKVGSGRSFDLQAASGLMNGETRATDITISPAGSTISIDGLVTLSFPANAVCDPATSSYGEGHWDEACTTLTTPITLHVTYGIANGSLGFDFSPAIRFAPNRSVTLSTDIFASTILANRDYYRGNKNALNALSLYYSSSFGSAAAKDWGRDGAVITHVDLNTGRVWRRIKHFSGYSMTSGQPCVPDPSDPDCVWVDDGGR